MNPQKPTQNNENLNMCAACKGACCKRFAGTVYPYQVKPLTPEKILEMLQGDYALDDWSGDPRMGKRALTPDHPDYHDFGNEAMNKRINHEDYLEYPNTMPEIEIRSYVYYLRPKHLSVDVGFKPGKSLAENVLETLHNIKANKLVRVNKPHDQSWGGQCVFLDEATGCKLKFEDRPHICQHLVPNYDFIKGESDCDMDEEVYSLHGKRLDAMMWLPYQPILERALEMYYEQKT